MTDSTVHIILGYYAFMWLANVLAYAVRSLALYRWKRFVKSTEAESMLKIGLSVAAAFAIFRLLAGLVGLYLYEFQDIPMINTILILGVTSLFLNTSFIMIEGWLLYRDASFAFRLPVEKQALVREATNVFSGLRRAANG